MTLRELVWMAEGRRECAGLLAAWHLAGVAGMFGAKIDPAAANPFRVERPKSEAAVRLEKWQKKRRFRAWVNSFGQLAKR